MVLSKITKGFIPKLIQEIDREGERGERRRRPLAVGAADEDELWSTIAPMATRKSRLGRCGSGGGHRQRGGGASRRPRANLRSPGKWERVVAAVNLECRAPVPLPFFIARATGAHQPYGLDTPDQGMFKRYSPIFGSGLGDQLQHSPL